jgi:hypothetical protein
MRLSVTLIVLVAGLLYGCADQVHRRDARKIAP